MPLTSPQSSVVFWRAVSSSLEAAGVPVAELLSQAGLPPFLLDDLLGVVSAREAALLRDAIAMATGTQGPGLFVGQWCSEVCFHLLGHVLLASATLREACRALEELGPLVLGAPVLRLTLNADDTATLALEHLDGCAEATFVSEVYLSVLYKLVRRYAGDARRIIHEVHFRHSAPRYSGVYDRSFGAIVHFDRPQCGVVFAQGVLDARRAGGDREVLVELRERIRSTFEPRQRNHVWSERVTRLLAQETVLAHVDFPRLAARFGLSLRTLRRRVAAEGQLLSGLLDDVRMQRAASELCRPDESIKEVAQRLGYSETSAFHRAFVRWSGITPNQYRKREIPSPAYRPRKPPVPERLLDV